MEQYFFGLGIIIEMFNDALVTFFDAGFSTIDLMVSMMSCSRLPPLCCFVMWLSSQFCCICVVLLCVTGVAVAVECCCVEDFEFV